MPQDLNITEDVKLLMRADLKRKSDSVILSVFILLQTKEVKWKSFNYLRKTLWWFPFA